MITAPRTHDAGFLDCSRELALYFIFGLVDRVRVAPQCRWQQLAAAAAGESQATGVAEDSAPLCSRAGTSAHCVHDVQVSDTARVLRRRVLRLPGIVLLAFRERVDAAPPVLAHLETHCVASPMYATLRGELADSAAVHAMMERSMAHARAGPHATTMVPAGTAFGRYAECYARTDPGAVSFEAEGKQWMLLGAGEHARMRAFFVAEARVLFPSLVIPAETQSRELMQLLLGRAEFPRDYAAVLVATSPRRGDAAPPVCTICHTHVANQLCMPCRHPMCGSCAVATFAFHADHVYPSGHPIPQISGVCPFCRHGVVTTIPVFHS